MPRCNSWRTLLGRYRSAAPMPDFNRVAVIRRRPLLAVRDRCGVDSLRDPRRRSFLHAREPLARDRSHRATRTFRIRCCAPATSCAPESGSVRLQSPSVGTIDLGANTTVRLIENRRRRHRLALAAGTIHAKTTSQPGVFVIDTPKARAIDLGCEYTLTIAPNGGGELHVISGWVDLTHGYEQSLVPQGASAFIENDGSLTVPVFDDAAPRISHSDRANHDMPDDRRARAHARRVHAAQPLPRRHARRTRNALRPPQPTRPRAAVDHRESVRYWSPSSTELWWRR